MLKQFAVELEEVKDEVMDLTQANSKATIKEFKEGPEFQKFLHTYAMGSFNMACNDMRRYLKAKCLTMDKSFVNVT